MEAKHFKTLEDGRAQCLLCPHECKINPGKTGICRTRKNAVGKLELLNYGRYSSISIDPIEKKPLYHFFPGSEILSIGGVGCNFVCRFCQNWSISQGEVPTRTIAPEALVEEAAKRAPANIGVAFTYNEPLVWFEFIRDTAPLLRERGLKTVLVSNGFINPEPFAELAPHIDAMNIDLKSSDDVFYKKQCGGSVEPVKATIAAAVRGGVWVEATQLLVTGLNDSEDQVERSAEWLSSVSRDIPLHLSRYFPNYKMDEPPTPEESMHGAWLAAKRHLSQVYLGNIAGSKFGGTNCPACGHELIKRDGYYVTIDNPAHPLTCGKCGGKVAGIDK